MGPSGSRSRPHDLTAVAPVQGALRVLVIPTVALDRGGRLCPGFAPNKYTRKVGTEGGNGGTCGHWLGRTGARVGTGWCVRARVCV